MKLKYKDDLQKMNLTNCPDKDCIERDINAYRWCYEDINHEQTWLTVAELDKLKNKFPRKFRQESICCDYFALSFYDSQENALDSFLGLPERNRQMLGYTHVASGNLKTTDGLCTPTNGDGHFNLHEYKDTSFENRFGVVCHV